MKKFAILQDNGTEGWGFLVEADTLEELEENLKHVPFIPTFDRIVAVQRLDLKFQIQVVK
jgi:hypothetical protein